MMLASQQYDNCDSSDFAIKELINLLGANLLLPPPYTYRAPTSVVISFNILFVYQLCLQLCIPDWPMYNKNPVTWLEEIGQSNSAPVSAPAATTKSKTKSSKKDKEHAN